jgi:type 2 lantibiotic biosynthesis protein LanM
MHVLCLCGFATPSEPTDIILYPIRPLVPANDATPAKDITISLAILHDPAWQRAWTLNERLSRFRQIKTRLATDRELAAETLALWRASSPFDKGTYFADRLAMEGITEDEFSQILGIPAEALGNDMPPAWVQTLACAYSKPLSPTGHQDWNCEESFPHAGFLELVEPLIANARLQLQAKVEAIKQAHATAPYDPVSAVDILSANLTTRLLSLITKTMVLELNIARLEGRLEGTTARERFVHFTERLSRRETACKLLSEYPVLARQLVCGVEHWIDFSAEFLGHLAVDWEEIAKLFNCNSKSGRLAEAVAGAGDTHRRGRSVLIARFEDGLKLVYKPRSIAVDVHFQEFLQWVNAKGASPQFRTLKLLNREGYSWVEFVQTAGCQSREEVVRFYERQGAYLAILYILEATDFHFENLLACGEHPVLVDLEALFHPRLREFDINLPDLRMAARAKSRSVLRTGLLPKRVGARADSIGMELSGLGYAGGQVKENILQWTSEGTDEMAAVQLPFLTPGGHNRPSVNGVGIDVREYIESIISGFTRTYELFRTNRGELLSPGDEGPLNRFAQDEIRVVPRATQGYGMLLAQMLHPDYLRDAMDRERLLDLLWAGVEENAHLLPLISAERRDLMEADIPIFTTRPDVTNIFTSTDEKIEDFLEKTGLSLSRKTVESLGPEDLQRQIWFIRASIATLDLQKDELTRKYYKPVWPSSIVGRKQLAPRLIEQARRVGTRLQELALQEEQHATWIGFAYVNKIWSLDPLFEDLYGGSSGIILALAYLGSFGFSEFTDLARRALNTLRTRLENKNEHIRSIGAFDGWSGIIYTLSHLATLWQDEELLSYADSLLDHLPGLLDMDKSLDIIGGCAGCIGALLAFERVSGSDKALTVAMQCGDRLLAQAQPMEHGAAWFNNIETAKPITGFAHGAAGIAWALLELAARTGNQKYKDAAIHAIEYEHTRYSVAGGNWTDAATDEVKDAKEEVGPSIAWCHGAPGIGLARLAALKHIDHPFIHQDLQRAIQATLNYGLGANHCLCHGDLGNLDFLFQASQTTNNPDLAEKVDQWTNQVLASMSKYGWLCGVPLAVESPSLMNGLAGICLGLLRIAAPDRIPSILTLSPAAV